MTVKVTIGRHLCRLEGKKFRSGHEKSHKGHGKGSLRHGVIAVTAPWMASEDAAQGQIEALERAMLSECLQGVLGTCRGETTGRAALQRRQTYLIETDQEDERSNGNLLQNRLELHT